MRNEREEGGREEKGLRNILLRLRVTSWVDMARFRTSKSDASGFINFELSRVIFTRGMTATSTGERSNVVAVSAEVPREPCGARASNPRSGENRKGIHVGS